MKKIIFAMCVLSCVNVFAGSAEVYSNEDESGIVINGDAAKALYDQMAVLEERSENLTTKYGKNISCNKFENAGPTRYNCLIGLVEVEVEGTDVTQFSGEVTPSTELAKDYKQMAQDLVARMYGKPGDFYVVKTFANPNTFEVILSNGADAGGSASYLVEITETENGASIKVSNQTIED